MKTNPPSSSFGDGRCGEGGGGGWMDRKEEIEKEKRRGRGGRGVIQEESHTVRLIRAASFVSQLIFSSEVVSWPSLRSSRQSVGLSVALQQIPPLIQTGPL